MTSIIRTIIKLLCAAACIAMVLIALVVYRADIRGLIIAAAFVVFYVQLPGQLWLRVLGFSPAHISTALAAGFFTGWAFVVLQYYITDFAGTNILLYAAGPICSVIWLFLRIKESRQKREEGVLVSPGFWNRFDSLSAALCIFLTIGLLYTLMLTQYVYLSPEVDEMITTNPDRGYHMGLINSLSHGWPLVCPWFAGRTIDYHIFTELLYSVPVRLFGLTSDTMLFSFGPYLTVYAIGTSLYALFREMCAKPERAGMYCLAVMLSNIFVCRGIDQSIAFLFAFRNENVVGYGVSGAFVLIILSKYWCEGHSGFGIGQEYKSLFAWRKFLLLLAVLMLVTGIKGPFGIVTVAAMWGAWVLGLILRQARLRMILPLILLTIGFYVIYAIVLNSNGQSTGEAESLIAVAKITDITFYKEPLIALMKSFGLPVSVRYVILLAVFAIFTLTAFFLPFVIGYIREFVLVITKRKAFDFTHVYVYAAALIGFIGMILLDFNGHSQIYFGFFTVFVAPLIVFWFFEDMEHHRGVVMQLIRGLFIICVVLSAVGLCSYILSQYDGDRSNADAANPVGNIYDSVTHEEYEAMRWIDDNTPRDSLLATDRYYTVDPATFDVTNRWDSRFFLYAVYSNRNCYLAGSGYNLPADEWEQRAERIKINDRLYDADDAERGELARSLGIDYVVVSKNYTETDNLENDDYQLCFSNDDIDIYEITE